LFSPLEKIRKGQELLRRPSMGLHNTKQVARVHMVHLSIAYKVTALIQRNAEFLSKSLEYYDASLVLSESEEIRVARNKTVREMKQWTGSLGKLTPGCVAYVHSCPDRMLSIFHEDILNAVILL
jgi:hypothetical protein